MRLTAEDYREAAGERLAEAQRALERGDHVATHLSAGLAIESMLRAYRVRVSPDFDERHDLSLLGAAYVRRMSRRRQNEMLAAINDAGLLWQNNHRYCCARNLRAYFNRNRRYQKERDMLRTNAQAMIDLATLIVRTGEERWHTPNIPIP